LSQRGDNGLTILFANEDFCSKNNEVCHFYGKLDTVSSLLGIIINRIDNSLINSQLLVIQDNIHDISSRVFRNLNGFPQEKVCELQLSIDLLSMSVPKITEFIRPCGCEEACLSHLARTLTREAERYLTGISEQKDIDITIRSYINKLSLYLFTLSRYLNRLRSVDDIFFKESK
jgi:cob(I)alamin adenosyltransferase